MATKFPRRFITFLTCVWLRNSGSSSIKDLASRRNKVYEMRDIEMGSAVMCSTTQNSLCPTQCGKRWRMKLGTITTFLFLASDVHTRCNLSNKLSFFYCCTVHLDNVKIHFFTTNCTLYWTYKMLKFTLKYLIFAPTCFGPFGPSSGSLQ